MMISSLKTSSCHFLELRQRIQGFGHIRARARARARVMAMTRDMAMARAMAMARVCARTISNAVANARAMTRPRARARARSMAGLCYVIAKNEPLCVKMNQGVPKWHRVSTLGYKFFAVLWLGIGLDVNNAMARAELRLGLGLWLGLGCAMPLQKRNHCVSSWIRVCQNGTECTQWGINCSL